MRYPLLSTYSTVSTVLDPTATPQPYRYRYSQDAASVLVSVLMFVGLLRYSSVKVRLGLGWSDDRPSPRLSSPAALAEEELSSDSLLTASVPVQRGLRGKPGYYTTALPPVNPV